jgi:hypothetical protein
MSIVPTPYDIEVMNNFIKEFIFVEHKRYSNVSVTLINPVVAGKLQEVALWLFSDQEPKQHTQVVREWNWGYDRFKRSKAAHPKPFKLGHGNKQCSIYPRAGKMGKFNFVGAITKTVVSPLHYVCQHLFDHYPRRVHDMFYDSMRPNTLGKLHTLKGEELIVRSDDILIGFMLTYPQCLEYGNKFSTWIRHRNNEREAKKHLIS